MDHETRTETQNYQTNHQFGRLPKGERRVRFADSMGMELVSIFLFDLIRNAYLDSFHSHKCLQAPPPSTYSLQMAARSLQKQPLAPTLHHNHQHNNNNNNNISSNTSSNTNTDNNNNNDNKSNTNTSNSSISTSNNTASSTKVNSHSLQNGVSSVHRNHTISSNSSSYQHSHRSINSINNNHYHSYYSNNRTAPSSSLSLSSQHSLAHSSSSSSLSLTPSAAAASSSSSPPSSVAAASSFVCEFMQPISLISFKERVKLNKVHLETCQINSSAGHMSVTCTIRVLNVSFDKSISVRYTTDDWRTHTDSLASYKPGSCDGWSDKFTSTFSITNQAKVLQPGQRIIFAIRYTIDGDRVHWDNNGGLNYSIKSLC